MTLFTIVTLVLISCKTRDPYPLHNLLYSGTEKQIKAFLADTRRAAQYINQISDRNQSPLLAALGAKRDVPIIKLLIESGADLKNGDNVAALYSIAADRGDYEIIKLLIDSGMPLPYSVEWQQFIEKQYALEPAQGVLLATNSLRFSPKPQNENYIMKVWNTWDAELKADPRFIAIVLRRAATSNSFMNTITKPINEIKKDTAQRLEFFDYFDKSTSDTEKVEYIKELFYATEAAIRANSEDTSEACKKLRDEIQLILDYYTIDLNFTLTSSLKW